MNWCKLSARASLAESQFRKECRLCWVAFCGTCVTVNVSELLVVELSLEKQFVLANELLLRHSMTVINCEVDVVEADNGNEQSRRDILKTMESRCISTYLYPG